MKRVLARLFVWLIVLSVVSAGASVVTSLPGGVVVPMPAIPCQSPDFACFGPGPSLPFGPGIVWLSTNAFNMGGSVFGSTGAYSFGSNGNWTGALGPMAGLNDSTDTFSVTDTMTFFFSSPLKAVGGFLNYNPGGSTPTTIAVYDSSDKLIEFRNLTFTTSGADNTGMFFGFQESSPIISSFTLTDNFVGITNLTIVSSIPEPASFLLLGSGLVGMVGYRRRRLHL